MQEQASYETQPTSDLCVFICGWVVVSLGGVGGAPGLFCVIKLRLFEALRAKLVVPR